MALYNQDQSQYVYFADPRSPVFFREAPFYNDVFYRRGLCDQHPMDPGYGGHFIPYMIPYMTPYNEQIFPRRENPWWYNHDFPHGWYGYPGYIEERQCPTEAAGEAVESTVMLYAPQLCCDKCERRVVKELKDFPDVQNVFADQWEKKVVVVGENLRPEQVLRRLQRVRRMDRSILWQDR